MNHKKLNVGILLCGGFGSRFSSDILKQMYIIDNLPIFAHSLKILLNTLDTVVIVVNSSCFNDIKKITESLDSVRIHIVINDVGDRLESIYEGICFIKNNLTANHIVIHDGARPFIKEEHILNLLSKMDDEILYTQYYFNLVNGLLKKNNEGKYEEVDRSEFIEICTPICANFKLYEFLFSNYMKKENRICWELIPLLDTLKIKYELLEGNYKYMRKITTLKDVF
jgi:2-C-methyl-D-erythritol 4-phosphate cytidylyltransferase